LGKLLVSISGIRGIVGDSLTSETAMQYGKAFGKYLKGGKVIIGRDTRYHGPMVLSAVAAGLMCSGCNVVDIGVATTPAIEFTVRETQSAGGIAITASHNPIEYNALKLIGPGGTFLTETQGKKFLKCCNSKQKSKKTEKLQNSIREKTMICYLIHCQFNVNKKIIFAATINVLSLT